jgi:DNA-binding NarL/FixJ family response regulator
MRIVVIDDHPLFREGVALTLAAEPDVTIVGEGGSAADAVHLASTLSPDIVLLDLDIPGGGLEALRAIGTAAPSTKVIMLTALVSEEKLMSVLQAGARAYVLKGVPARELAQIARSVLAGHGYVPPALASQLLTHGVRPPSQPSQHSLLDELTEREHQILALVACGESNQQIALSLHLSEKTIKNHMTAIMQKLQVRNRVEAALLVSRLSRNEAG